MNEKEMAQQIFESVGGAANITSVKHCVTRLRLTLHDESLVDEEAINKIPKVQKIIKAGGQFQIVIGVGIVDRVYDEFLGLTGTLNDNEPKKKGKKKGFIAAAIDLISSIMLPVLPLLIAGGMLKGLVALFVGIGVLAAGSPTQVVLNAIGDLFFFYFPVFLGYSAMKKFGGTPLLGALIGLVLVCPTINDLASAESIATYFAGTPFEMAAKSEVFGIPIVLPMFGYAYSVLPAIGMAYIGAVVEKLSKKWLPDVLAFFFAPMLALLLAALLGLWIIGPILTIATNLLLMVFMIIMSISPFIYGVVLGGLYQLLVLFGLHTAIMPVMIMELMTNGTMTLGTPILPCSFAMGGAAFAVMLRYKKDKEMYEVAAPAAVTATFFGITEPVMYGVALPLKKPFIVASVVSGITAGFMMVCGVTGYTMAGLGIFSLPAYIDPNSTLPLWQQPNLMFAIIGIIAAFLLAFVGTYVWCKPKKLEYNEIAFSPVKGKNIPLSEVNDEVFATETLGATIAIEPSGKDVYAPFAGTITALFPTYHAIGITSEEGIELLIHIGINTVDLKGEGFTAHVAKGDKVNLGDKLVSFDNKLIKEKGYDTTILLAITNVDKEEIIKSKTANLTTKTCVFFTKEK